MNRQSLSIETTVGSKNEEDDELSSQITQLGPPTLKSFQLGDMKTPPQGSNPKFTDNGQTTCEVQYYDDIQNLPTPIVPNFQKPYSSRSPNTSPKWSPPSTHDSIFPIKEESPVPNLGKENNSTLIIPKTRTRKTSSKIIRVDTNLDSFGADENKVDQKRFISDYKLRNRDEYTEVPLTTRINHNEALRSPLINRNINPIDRVVSLPIHSKFRPVTPKARNQNELPRSIPQIDSNIENMQNGESILQEVLKTYSVDGKHDLQKWEPLYEIGCGSFSKVYLCSDGQTVLKISDVSFSKESQNSKDMYLRIQNSLSRELEVLKELKHPNIIKLIGSDYKPDLKTDISRITIVMEYCKGGDLYNFILNYRSEMNSELIRCMFTNLVSAISFMHSKNICHRDIKLENILLKYSQLETLDNGVRMAALHTPILVLSDFGLSKRLDPANPMLTTRCGSEDYVSPELLLGMPYDGKQNDCWSMGVVLYTMLESRLPFDPLPSEANKPTGRRSKPAHRIAMINWTWYYLKDETLSEEFASAKEIVKLLLTKRNKRATVNDIENHRWCKPYILKGDS